MESGQPPQFLWKKDGERYYRYVGGEKCHLWQEQGLNYTPGFREYIMELLRAEDDLERIYREINTDDAMRNALERYRGLRITKNDPWETLVSFVCSINNNIPRICRNVQSLIYEGRILSPKEILTADLKECKLGFRESFLSRIAEMMPSYDLDKIGRMSYEDAKDTLMEFPGVGDKVSECVLLFGYGFLEAFPIDIWMRRAMNEYYGISKPKEIKAYAAKKWGPYAGYAQQYLYCAIRGV
jgi:N-glycosylase/DNA lyase